jgi:hypothetical protein
MVYADEIIVSRAEPRRHIRATSGGAAPVGERTACGRARQAV